MQDKIIAAIAAYLEKETKVIGFRNDRHRIEFCGAINHGHFTHAGFCKEIATVIAAAIAPLVEAGEEPKKCGNCNKNEARLLHACPYREELYNDEETPCDCCFECTGECKDRV